MVNQNDDYTRIFDRVNRAIQALPTRIAVLAVNFTKERFVQKNWIDTVAVAWKQTKKKKGSTLVASGRLKRSPRKTRVSSAEVVIGTDVPYARAHNEGEEFSGTENVRRHTRKQYRRRSHTRKGKPVKAQIVKSHTVKPYSRKYKRKFVKRQFIGKSKELNNRLDTLTYNEIDRALIG